MRNLRFQNVKNLAQNHTGLKSKALDPSVVRISMFSAALVFQQQAMKWHSNGRRTMGKGSSPGTLQSLLGG